MFIRLIRDTPFSQNRDIPNKKQIIPSKKTLKSDDMETQGQSPVLGLYSQAGTLVAILLRVSDGSGTEMWIGSETWIVSPCLSKS